MAVHEVLADKRAETLERWKRDVRGTLAPDAMPPMELLDQMPQFLNEVGAALREAAGRTTISPSPEQTHELRNPLSAASLAFVQTW
jgi:hypothetical protein